ncbi:MAG: DUF6603 domain-containing protein [Hoeflea sp.]|uniref:DUF6603 domain-containing protein n=1 Tax=Hoeflea sp. TaxID=1940281 RepID=UPI003EF160AF
MTGTPLDTIELDANAQIKLAADVLGDEAFLVVSTGFQLGASPIKLTGAAIETQTANLLVLTGTIPDLPGMKNAKAAVRAYIFEVPNAASFALVDRHCLFLIDPLPAAYDTQKFWTAFGTDAVTTLLSASGFDQGAMVFSTLDFTQNSYTDPPCPLADDKALSAPQAAFVQSVRNDITVGFTYRLKATLVQTHDDGAGNAVSKTLAPLKLNGLFNALQFIAQGKIQSAGVQLVLWAELKSDDHPASSSQPFPLNFAEFGLAFPIHHDQGATSTVLPVFLLRGEMSFGSGTCVTPTKFSASFDVETSYLFVDILDFPSFEQIEASLKSGLPSLGDDIAAFLPMDQAKPGSALAALGSISLHELAIGINFEALSFDYLKVSFVTAAPFKLADVVTVMPALEVTLFSPFNPAFRQYEVDVAGQWTLGEAEIATVLVVEDGNFTLDASLARGHLDLSHIAEVLLMGQVSGLPELDLSSFEMLAQYNQTTGSKYFQIEAEIESHWKIGDLPLIFEDMTFYANYADAKLNAAALTGTLEIASIPFNLGAEYDGADGSWTFSGGTNAEIQLDKLLQELASDLGVEGHGRFLDAFTGIDVTGFYLKYHTGTSASAGLQLFIGLDDKNGFAGGVIPLDTLSISLNSSGGSTKWQFDGSSTLKHPGWATKLSQWVKSLTQLDIELPSSINELELKGLSGHFDSATKNYEFRAFLKFGSNALLHVTVSTFSQAGKGYEKDISGKLILHPGDDDHQMIFDLELKTEKGANEFVAYYRAENAKGINLVQLLQAVDDKIDFGDAFAINVKDVLFAHTASGGTKKSLFAIDMDAGINLSGLGDLPLVGKELAAAKSLTLVLQILYAMGGKFAGTDLQKLNQDFDLEGFEFPDKDINAGAVSLSSSLRMGDETAISITLPVSSAPANDGTLQPDANQKMDVPSATAATSDGVKWISLQKTFGPLALARVGFAYKDGKIFVYLDGSLSMMGLTVSLMGLNVGVALSGTSKFHPVFGLEGLGIDLKNGPLEIGGGLIKVETDNMTEFNGFVTIRTEELEIGALGSFAEMQDGHDSLFVYAVLDYPVGGPAFFFVTGLAAGFGYNRKMLVPPVGEIQNFPLITEAVNPTPAPKQLGEVQSYISSKLAMMDKYLPPAVGEYFVTAGIRFTSFDLVDSFLVLTVQFGKHFEVDILGISTAVLPPETPDTPIMEAQLALRATFIPDEGTVMVQGQLTPASYIFSRSCHLTGGFAFGLWFGGPHAGDFVTTIGGYHPDFKPPKYYPNVPRVGFNWAISNDLHVKGGGYFALVSHALMAGGSLSAVWQSGSVKAWFDMGADFLIRWKPFSYTADIYVDLGAEVTVHFFGTHHLSFDASADLLIWGPEFGGRAHISLSVIGIHVHFTVHFGSSHSTLPPLKWDEFNSSFLPAPEKRVSASIANGLQRTVQDSTLGEVWIIKRDQLRINTHSCFPVKDAKFSLDGQTTAHDMGTVGTGGVAPMNLDAAHTSTHTISVSRIGHNTALAVGALASPTENLKLVNTDKAFPSALWGHEMEQDLNAPASQRVVAGVSGFSVVPKKTSNPGPPITVKRSSLAYDPYTYEGFTWVPSIGKFAEASTQGDWSILQGQIQATQSKRDSLLSAMGFDPSEVNFNKPVSQDVYFLPEIGTIQ